MNIEEMGSGLYALIKDKKVVPVNDVLEWAPEIEKADRVVAKDIIGDSTISTVFLGIDHGFGLKTENKLWFETMIFGGEQDGFQKRYETWDEAEAGHKLLVTTLKGIKQPGENE